MRLALRAKTTADVPCGTCQACCTSGQFVHIEPDETDTLGRIPAELLFPAPGRPPGHVLLGYDADGRCPMLGEAGCTIYEHRPRTCRTYDCRVLAAAGVVPDEPGKEAIAARVVRWRWDKPSAELDAVRAAARWLEGHGDELPAPARPVTATARAVLAFALADCFAGRDAPDPEEIRRRAGLLSP